MKIVLGSKNESKINSIILGLKELDIDNVEIVSVDAKSDVSSKPINDDTLQGAINRNRFLLKYCKESDINFDYLISIEGGYEQILDKYFIVTYASIVNKDGLEFIGKSQGLEITEKMFNWVKDGNSLNGVIEKIEGCLNNKKTNGISGYLSNGFYKRDFFDSSAIISAFVSMLNYKKMYKEVNKML